MPRQKVWNPIKTVPRNVLINLKSVRGIECKGIVPKREKVRKADAYGPARINAHRTDDVVKIGDIRAVGWRK